MNAIITVVEGKMLGACIIVLISAQLCPTRATVLDRTYTNEWAVKVSGGFERANEIASKHGFENRGLVGDSSCTCMHVG